MRFRNLLTGLGLLLAIGGGAGAQPPTATARVETASLEVQQPDRFRIPSALEPSRKVVVVAPADGVLRSLAVEVGASVREGQEIGQFDRAEADARVRIAQAIVAQRQAQLEAWKGKPNDPGAQVARAELDEAVARADLAKLELSRCTLRAPFAGRLAAIAVSPGQYLPKGGTVAELADISGLRALVPLDRPAARVGATTSLRVEGRPVSGKVITVVPLPERFASLRELATPLAGAWVAIENPDGSLEPGQRIAFPSVPDAPLTVLPARAVRDPDDEPSVQVLRNELVADLPIRVIGEAGTERLQVSGAFRPDDILIVSSSTPLLAGTLVRFEGRPTGPIEGQAPRPDTVGEVAGITPPVRPVPGPAPTPGVAPIGAPGSALPRGSVRPGTTPAPAPSRPAQPVNTVPF